MTRRFISFLNCEGAGNGLGIFLINCRTVTESLIVFTGQRYRTYVNAVATGSAFEGIDITGCFVERNCKITCVAFDFFNFGAGDQIDI